MKTVIAFLIMAHGLIHVLGFLKAYKITAIEQLKKPISKIAGFFWLFSFFTFVTTAVFYLTGIEFWISSGVSGIIISQILIIKSWQDAKFGTVLNVLLSFLIFISL